MFYLAKEDWSPRFDNTFFTISIDTRTTCTSPPESSFFKGNNFFPAVYFNIKVQCGRQEYICSRRYSQFRSLYDELCSLKAQNEKEKQQQGKEQIQSLHFPPKTCFFQSIDEQFLDIRQEELYQFLSELLKRPGYVDHSVVHVFLDLDQVLQSK